MFKYKLIVVLMLIASFVQAQNFSVDWGGEPAYTEKTTEITEGVVVDSKSWVLDVEDKKNSNWRYFISTDEYPANYIHSDSSLLALEKLILSTQNMFLENNDFELMASSEIDINNYYGKEFRWKDLTKDEFFRIDVYVIENTIYQVGVNSKRGQNHNTDTAKFFESFKLDPKLKGKYTKESSSYVPGYSIKFPQEPSYLEKVIDSEVGKLTLHFKIFEPSTDEENNIYMTSETLYPQDMLGEATAYALDKFYIESILGSVSAVDGTLISIKDISLNENRGKEYKMYFSEGVLIFVYKIFLINNTLYSIAVMTTPDKDNNKSMMQFFDSFEVK